MAALSVVNRSRSVGAVRGPDYPFSAALLAVRERIRNEIRTRNLQGSPGAHNSVS